MSCEIKKMSLTLSRSRLCPYSSRIVVPLCITPFPVIIHVPVKYNFKKIYIYLYSTNNTFTSFKVYQVSQVFCILPERRLVMVEGSCRYAGLCVVTPISMEPAHLSTILSMRTWNTSLERSGRLLRTTPWLKSSVALWKQRFQLQSPCIKLCIFTVTSI